MAISRVKIWATLEQLASADLNAEFNNILNNATSLVSPLTANLAAGGFKVTGLGAATANGDAVRYEQVERYVRKTADETVNNSTTLQNDDHLLLSVEASQTYKMRLWLMVNAASDTPGLKLFFTGPAGAALSWADDTQISTVVTIGDTIVAANLTGTEVILISGVLVTAGTAGNLQLQWAQNALHASDTKLLTNSMLSLTRLT